MGTINNSLQKVLGGKWEVSTSSDTVYILDLDKMEGVVYRDELMRVLKRPTKHFRILEYYCELNSPMVLVTVENADDPDLISSRVSTLVTSIREYND